MTLSKEQQASLLEASKPLIKWLNDNCHPHCTAIAEAGSVKLVEGIARQVTNEFIKD